MRDREGWETELGQEWILKLQSYGNFKSGNFIVIEDEQVTVEHKVTWQMREVARGRARPGQSPVKPLSMVARDAAVLLAYPRPYSSRGNLARIQPP